jgi:FkbM family methyltransferase
MANSNVTVLDVIMAIKLILRKIIKAFVPYGILWIKKKYLYKKYNNLYDFFANNPDKAEKFMQYIYGIIVKEGDCVIDVGANHGLHTIPLSKLVGESGIVLACEAIENYISDIKSKTNAQNIQFYCAAITKPDVAEHIKEISFNYFPNKDGYSGIMKIPGIKDKEILVTVPTSTLDKIVTEQRIYKEKQISFIKVDVEGGDFDVLLGAENTLKEYKPVVIFESGRQFSANLYNYTKEDFFKYFEKIGYVMFQFTGGILQKDDWSKNNVYWETWLIHKDSSYLSFFKNNYINFANIYKDDQ